MAKYQLTKLDWKILEHLQNDGRMSISVLAKKLNRSRSNISEHIEQLVSEGVLKNFSISVDPEKLGVGVSAFVRLQASSKEHRKIVNQLTALPEVSECHVMTGTELVILRVFCKNMIHLREMVDDLTQLGSTQTDIIFATTKENLKLNDDLYQCFKP